MCGLAGRINAGKAPVHALTRGMHWLARRGPDHQGAWMSADGGVELLHTRLLTVDPHPRANQPFVDADHRIAIAFNGDIYNYRDIKKRYPDYPYRTDSDTEAIVAAYVTDGTEAFREFRGCFSFALVDIARGQVVLARDPIGKKPLYLARWGEQVLFGSSLLPMVSGYGGPLSLDECAVEDYWALGHVRPHRAIFEGVEPLRPGEVLTLDWQGAIVGRTDCTPPSEERYAGESIESVDERIRALLRQAVERRLPSQSPPAFLLSGGIDSSSICESFQRHCPDLVSQARVATLGSVIPCTNDERYARFAARRLGFDLQVVRPHSMRLGEKIAHALAQQDEPLGMIAYFNLFVMIEQIKDCGRVVIGGDGGDEVFCGYDEVAQWTDRGGHDPQPQHPMVCAGPPLPDWMSPWGRRIASEGLIGHQFAKADRASAEQAVVLRSPLLDWDLVDYARSLPPAVLLHGDRSKALLKRQLRTWPDWFVNRRKIGFAYNLRWFWALSNFRGMRELVDGDTVDRFADRLSPSLRMPPRRWSARAIFANFTTAWKLLAWSRFESRLVEAG